MKKIILTKLALASVILLFWSCQTPDTTDDLETNETSKVTTDSSRAAAACNPTYALVLSAGTGTPVPPGLTSYIYKVDFCSGTVGYAFLSAITIGGTQVTDVTGLADMPGVPDFAWAVTGMNSNFPQKLLKVQLSTGIAGVVFNTTAPLQDIENYGNTGLFLAIKEGTSQIMRVNVATGVCTPFTSIAPLSQYNGLTFVGNKVHVISGNSATICSPNLGDILEYDLSGALIGRYSYKNLTSNINYTTKELGFHFDGCCGKRWVVGSSLAIISNNTNITPCVLPNPTFLLNTMATGQPQYAIYDFMLKL